MNSHDPLDRLQKEVDDLVRLAARHPTAKQAWGATIAIVLLSAATLMIGWVLLR